MKTFKLSELNKSSNMNKENIVIHTSGLPTLLTVAFVVLKLCGVINWSWWWVISPILIPLSIYFILFFTLVLLIIITNILK